MEQQLAALRQDAQRFETNVQTLERDEKDSAEIGRFLASKIESLQSELRGASRLLEYEQSAWTLLERTRELAVASLDRARVQSFKDLLRAMAAAIAALTRQTKTWSDAQRVTVDAAVKVAGELETARKLQARALVSKHESDHKALQADAERFYWLLQAAKDAKVRVCAAVS